MQTEYRGGSVFLTAGGFWIAQWELPRLPDGRRRRRQLRAETEEAAHARMRSHPEAPPVIPSREHRFWGNVDWPDGEDGCWVWTGTKLPKGYGLTKWDGRTWQAHRLAWTLIHGEIPDGLWVLHHCDNPPCVNPDHLWLGTAANNTADMVAKGRGHWQAA